jgi:NAD(P)H-hydrate epimerase
MAGAAYLCGGAVLKSGAGMVKIHTVEENRVILQQLLPEALLYTDTEEDSLQPGKAQLEKKWEKNLDWADVVVMGPGIGTNLPVVTWYLEHFKKPMVLDADALNLMAEHPKLLENIGPHCILTPHPGELGRLMKLPVGKLKEDYLHFVKKFADEYKVTCVGKDARTVTVTCRGQIWLNLSGNDGMATAGSGDVLSGILGGLLAQGMPVCEAAPFGVYLHGLAGDAQAKRKGRRSLLASDLLKGLEKILKKCEEKE